MHNYKIILVTIFTFLTQNIIYSSEICSSNPNESNTEYKTNDLVFLGRMETYDKKKKVFKFKIIDLFKGFHFMDEISITFKQNNEKIIKELENSEKDPYWIIYANRTGLNTAVVDYCGASRNQGRISKQEIALRPPPEKFESQLDSLYYIHSKSKILIQKKEEWIEELLSLKEKRKSNTMKTWILISLLAISLILNFVLFRKNR